MNYEIGPFHILLVIFRNNFFYQKYKIIKNLPIQLFEVKFLNKRLFWIPEKNTQVFRYLRKKTIN